MAHGCVSFYGCLLCVRPPEPRLQSESQRTNGLSPLRVSYTRFAAEFEMAGTILALLQPAPKRYTVKALCTVLK